MHNRDADISDKSKRKVALRFVISIGIVSLFADCTYEGGRSIVGPYLAVLGAGPILWAWWRAWVSFSVMPCGCSPGVTWIARAATGR